MIFIVSLLSLRPGGRDILYGLWEVGGGGGTAVNLLSQLIRPTTRVSSLRFILIASFIWGICFLISKGIGPLDALLHSVELRFITVTLITSGMNQSKIVAIFVKTCGFRSI